MSTEAAQACARLLRSHQARRATGTPCVSLLVGDATAADVLRAILTDEGLCLIRAFTSDQSAMCRGWLHGLEEHVDLLDEAFAYVANALGDSDAELRAAWSARGDRERRCWLEARQSEAAPSLRAALQALCNALDQAAESDAKQELESILRWLPQREGLVLGLDASGPAALRSLVAFAERNPALAVLAIVEPRSFAASRAQLDSRTLAMLDSGRLPDLDPPANLTATLPEAVVEPLTVSTRALGDPAQRQRLAERRLVEPDPREDPARSEAERMLFRMLEADPVTRGLFEQNVRMPFTFGPGRAEVDLVCRELRLAVEVDGYFHFHRLDSYRRDRRKDVLLQHHGYIVSRHLAADVEERAGDVVRAIRELVKRRRRSSQREDEL